MFHWILIFFVAVILILILFYNVVNHNEDKALYYPSKKMKWKPDVKYKEIYINVNDGRDICHCSRDKKRKNEYIHGWHFNNYKGKKTIIFYHGTTGSIANRQYIIDICEKFKLNLLLIDYRGYGKSDSFPHKLFLREDGELAYEYLHDYCKIANKNIILWGESLGGVSAVWTASKHECGGLILICSFSSLDDAITYRFEGYKKTGVKFLTDLLSCKMDMIPLKGYLKDVSCPVVIIHSTEDELIPYACSWLNYHSIKHKNKLHVKIKGGHASPDIKSHQLKKIFDFCNLPSDNISNTSDISEMLEDLKTYAKRHNNFMD